MVLMLILFLGWIEAKGKKSVAKNLKRYRTGLQDANSNSLYYSSSLSLHSISSSNQTWDDYDNDWYTNEDGFYEK